MTVLAVGCGTESEELEQHDTDNGGVLTGFIDDGADADDGLDETGDGVFNGCVLSEDADIDGGLYAHQCAAEYDLVFEFDFDPLTGSTVHITEAVTAHTLNDSTYEHPFVAACCTDIQADPNWVSKGDTCAMPHHEACYSDLVQHLCNVPSVWIAKAAENYTANGQSALNEAAKWFKNHRNDCYDHFWAGSDGLYMADYCGTDFDVFYDHPAWEPSVTFTVDVFGVEAEASGFSLSPRTIFDTKGVVPLPASPDSCDAPVENEGEVPPVSDPSGGSVLASPASDVALDVVGPLWGGEVITGAGDFGDNSWLAHERVGADLSIEGWSMFEAGPTTVGTSVVTAGVSGFRLDQIGAVVATGSGGTFSIGGREALFHLGASVDGVSDYVVAKNTTTILFDTIVGGSGTCPTSATECLVSRPFSIRYLDVFNDAWELDIGSATWVP